MDSYTSLNVAENVADLIFSISRDLKKECERLYKSGMIDIQEYNGTDRLAKVLLTAAMINISATYYPINNKKLETDLVNLTK